MTELRERSRPRVLVVEDEALIAMMMEDMLEDMGCHVAGIVGSLSAALPLARTATIDVALLDVNLGGTPIDPVLSILEARGIPCLLVTGYDRADLSDRYAACALLRKPVNPAALRAALARCMERTTV